MLFHSIDFIFGFLPACFLAFVLIRKLVGKRASILWLCAASIFFYGQWSLTHAMLLVGSVSANFVFVKAIMALNDRPQFRKLVFWSSIAANLGLLGYLKYSNFFIENINAVSGAGLDHLSLIVPIGVSFFTFIQIGFLMEVNNRQVKEVGFLDYFMFGSFFSYVTAGPLVLQRDILPQLKERQEKLIDPMRIAIAVTIFGIGLFKKLALADAIAPFADVVFDGAAGGALPSASLAWIGAMAYTAQLYFDFSGYSDMALGIGLLFNIKLPFNFNSPLKASSISDFWRRWHMTMTRFFTNYIYAPLAINNTRSALINRHGAIRKFAMCVAIPVIITFLLAGIWHGAGWTFVVFGLIHGFALAINHAWTQAKMPALPQGVGWLLTMLVVVVGLVVFRASDLATAGVILQAMAVPDLSQNGWIVAGEMGEINYADAIAMLTLMFGIILMMPNTQQLFSDQKVSSDPADYEGLERPRWLSWRPSPRWAMSAAVLLAIGLSLATGDTAFIYYQF